AKEYAEARLTAAMVGDGPLPSAEELGISPAAWLNGLAEAASELRRHLLDRLRHGDLSHGEALLQAMDEAYGLLVTMDYPDAVSGGLRRTTDALRAVLERTRGDLTTTILQSRLQNALNQAAAALD
ncbi:MAG TPA: haloacid dehalogenase, partial [Actinomycetota bacterium]|nr:haloacid dehalogenase [Actinomycetota bacterium]